MTKRTLTITMTASELDYICKRVGGPGFDRKYDLLWMALANAQSDGGHWYTPAARAIEGTRPV